MIDLDRHPSLGSALRSAFDRHADRLCLIEADRDRERARLTYAEVDAAARALGGWLRRAGARRVAIVMTNQSKWHVSACAVFLAGAVLVPLDPKLAPPELEALLEHSGADTLVVEHHLWRPLACGGRVLVTEAPESADLSNGTRWEDARAADDGPAADGARDDVACIVYSSGTGGRPKGCVLTHGNYLAQCAALLDRYAFAPGDRYLSILPTNHAIDFMVGFLGPYVCGATVVHLRTLRPEFVKEAFPRYGITYMALVPMVLSSMRAGLEARIRPLRPLVGLNRMLTRGRPRPGVSRVLLRPVHKGFGGRLKTLFVGGAFTDPTTLRFFYDLGIQVVNGYGLTEAGTVVTLNDFDDYRPETVGRPLAGTEVAIQEPGPDGVGEVKVRGPTVMARYLDDPELTAETIVDGWLMTGDLGALLPSGHLVLHGRRKNMIVTAGGKNIYPEDIENAFDGLPVKEYCVFAAHYLWAGRDERLVLVVRGDPRDFRDELVSRNRRLPDFKRVAGFLDWPADFPRTASLKIKRDALADALRAADPADVVEL